MKETDSNWPVIGETEYCIIQSIEVVFRSRRFQTGECVATGGVGNCFGNFYRGPSSSLRFVEPNGDPGQWRFIGLIEAEPTDCVGLRLGLFLRRLRRGFLRRLSDSRRH